MRKLFTVLVAVLLAAGVFAQSPEKMSYQAVVRDGSNSLVTSTAVGMKISILKGSTSGTALYVETQTPTTNANGLVSIIIGAGTVQSGDFTKIDWANGQYFIKTETDPTGGTSYTITGTSQLLSVPYALHAKTADSIIKSQWTTTGSNIYYNTGLVGIGINTNPTAVLELYDNKGYHFLKFVSEDNVYTTWQSDRSGVDDYQIGIDGGNNRFNIANTTTGYYPMTIQGKNIGIGTLNPEAPLHITDFMKLEPRSTSPSSPTKGMIYYDSTDNKLKVYTGSAWENLN